MVIWRAICRCGGDYVGVAATTTLAFAPALAVAWLLRGRAGWVQTAALGPLCVLPMLFVARLLGTWVDAHRQRLGSLVESERLTRRGWAPITPAGEGSAPTTAAAAPAAARSAPRSIEGRQPQRKPTDQPDLRHMTSATVLSGTQRSHSGAAAKHV